MWLVGAVGIGGAVVTAGIWYYFSPEFTDVGYRPVQPVPYSHKLHAGDLQIDCRYCHAAVETSHVASVPPTQVCLNCHRVVKRDSPKLAPIHESKATGEPMRWIRVHNVPDYAYFNHSAHVFAGVGCESCHGNIAEMEVVTLREPLSMGWCLDCHRNPDPHLRPADEVTAMGWIAPDNQLEIAARLKAEKNIAPPVDCSGCHR